jgi:outer membrane immunogenic protein
MACQTSREIQRYQLLALKSICERLNWIYTPGIGFSGRSWSRGIVMKKLILSTVAVLFAMPAFAADMALKAPPPPAPVYDWTGGYVGLNLGGSWGRASSTITGTNAFSGLPFAVTSSSNMNGILGGGQIGYNWQVNTSWLLGLEADIQGTGQRGTANPPPVSGVTGIIGALLIPYTSTASLTEKLPWFGTVRGRLGLLASPSWLLYVTGGLAYGQINSSGTVSTTTTTAVGTATVTGTSSNNTTKAGWTIGGGAEWKVAPQWTVKAEYLYVDLGTVTNTFVGNGAFSALGVSTRVTDNIARVGVDYHFH